MCGVFDNVGTLTPMHVDVSAPQNCQQPGPRMVAIEMVYRAPCTNQCLLDEIISICSAASERARDAQKHLDFRFNVLPEPCTLAGLTTHRSCLDLASLGRLNLMTTTLISQV